MIGDPHLHSTYSDGKQDPAALLALSGFKGLDFVAIADHNTAEGSHAAHEAWLAAGRAGVCPGLAQEVSTEERMHLLIYGLTESLGALRRRHLPEVLARVAESGGAIALAHPWSILDHPRARALAAELAGEGLLHGIEMASAAVFYEEFGRWRESLLWCEETFGPLNLAAISGTDYHEHQQGFAPGLGRTLYRGRLGHPEDFVTALRAGQTVAMLHPPTLSEHDLAVRADRETSGLPSADGAGFYGDRTKIAGFRTELGLLRERLELLPFPRRIAAQRLWDGGSYGALEALLQSP